MASLLEKTISAFRVLGQTKKTDETCHRPIEQDFQDQLQAIYEGWIQYGRDVVIRNYHNILPEGDTAITVPRPNEHWVMRGGLATSVLPPDLLSQIDLTKMTVFPGRMVRKFAPDGNYTWAGGLSSAHWEPANWTSGQCVMRIYDQTDRRDRPSTQGFVEITADETGVHGLTIARLEPEYNLYTGKTVLELKGGSFVVSTDESQLPINAQDTANMLFVPRSPLPPPSPAVRRH